MFLFQGRVYDYRELVLPLKEGILQMVRKLFKINVRSFDNRRFELVFGLSELEMLRCLLSGVEGDCINILRLFHL